MPYYFNIWKKFDAILTAKAPNRTVFRKKLGNFPFISDPGGLFWVPDFAYFNTQWRNGDGLRTEGRKSGGPTAACQPKTIRNFVELSA